MKSVQRPREERAKAALRRLLRLGMRRKRDGYKYESGKRQETMQHGWFLERLIVVGAKLAIESVAKLAAGAEVASKKEVTGD